MQSNISVHDHFMNFVIGGPYALSRINSANKKCIKHPPAGDRTWHSDRRLCLHFRGIDSRVSVQGMKNRNGNKMEKEKDMSHTTLLEAYRFDLRMPLEVQGGRKRTLLSISVYATRVYGWISGFFTQGRRTSPLFYYLWRFYEWYIFF